MRADGRYEKKCPVHTRMGGGGGAGGRLTSPPALKVFLDFSLDLLRNMTSWLIFVFWGWGCLDENVYI